MMVNSIRIGQKPPFEAVRVVQPYKTDPLCEPAEVRSPRQQPQIRNKPIQGD